jgi:uncharacterized protein YdcH (DUF465 family)
VLREEEIIKVLKRENEEFKRLSDEHKNLEKILVEFDSKRYLSPDEEFERKRIQKQKLLKKDRMAELIRGYKKTHTN